MLTKNKFLMIGVLMVLSSCGQEKPEYQSSSPFNSEPSSKSTKLIALDWTKAGVYEITLSDGTICVVASLESQSVDVECDWKQVEVK